MVNDQKWIFDITYCTRYAAIYLIGKEQYRCSGLPKIGPITPKTVNDPYVYSVLIFIYYKSKKLIGWVDVGEAAAEKIESH